MRHRVLKWARFSFSYCYYYYYYIQITLDIFQNCDVPEEVSGTFDPEVDLNDDAVVRYHYERFYSVCSPIMRQKI